MSKSAIRGAAFRSVAVTAVIVATAALLSRALPARADTAPLPYHAVVPGLALDAGAATPTVTNSALVTVGKLGRSTVNGDGQPSGLTVYGEVHNGLDHPIGSVTVSVSAPGQAARTGVVAVDTIPAGGDGPFIAQMIGAPEDAGPLSATIAGFTDLTPAAAATTTSVYASGPGPMFVGDPDKVTGIRATATNLLSITGSVTNTGASPIHVTEVVLAYYDADGNVSLVVSTSLISAQYPGADPARIAPGTAGNFQIAVPRATLLGVREPSVRREFVSATPAGS